MKEIWAKYKDWFIENYPILCADELVRQLPFSKDQIKTAASRFKLRKKGQLDSWNYADELKLIELYSDMSNAELGELFGRSEGTVSAAGFKLGLKKSVEFHRTRSAKGFFPRGHVPQNKGKKQIEYMSPEAIAKTVNTRFKKGEPNHNSLYDGCITIRHDHPNRANSKPHKYIRISKGIWKELQIYNWEQINGPLPEGYILACQDGDTLNCDPSNWEAMTLADNARRNAGHKNLPDKYVAGLLAGGGRKAKVNKDLKEIYIQQPELIDIKRKQLLLNRAIKNEVSNRKSTT